MTTPEAETLGALRELDGHGRGANYVTLAALADATGKSPTTLARHLRYMADRGEVRRVRSGDLALAPGRGTILGYRVAR